MYELTPRRLLSAFARVVVLFVILALVATGLVFVSANVSTPATAFAFHSAFEDQGPSPTLAPGTTASYSVRFRNTGARPWTRGGAGQQVNLGVVGDDKSMFALAAGWPTADRVAVQTEPTVSPGGIATYTFRVKAPMAAGIYPLRLRLVADGVTWLDDEDVVTLVTVGATAGAPTDKAFITSPATFTFVVGTAPLTTAAGRSVKVTTTVTSVAARTAVIGVDVYTP